MPLTRPVLTDLAAAFGVSTGFWDWKGRHVEVDDATVVGVLAGLGVDARTDEAAASALADRRLREWRRHLPPCTVVQEGSVVRVPVHVPAGDPAWVWVILESGERRDAQQVSNDVPDRRVDGAWVGEGSFEVRDLPLGYHRLHLRTPDGSWTAPLIITPRFLGFPAAMGGRRVWGYATQLYSVRSQRSWEIGDFRDLADLATWSGTQHSADYVLVNPLHAAEPMVPLEPSPYLPSSRRYLNPIYVRPEAIAEYADLGEDKRERIRVLREELGAVLSGSDLIERDPVWLAKIEALRLIHDEGLTPARALAREKYSRTEGRSLIDFATWCVLATIHGADWREWPVELQDPNSSVVAEVAATHGDDIDFFSWLQWVADQQLGAAQSAAGEAGMRIGIVNDLAVGVSQGSADAWILGETLASGVTIGAPPDQYNQLGQDWGQAPWQPDRLEEAAYQPFRQTVRSVFRHAGGARIDHIMGLFRLWWIPEGLSPLQGTYVRYNHQALVGILALEAHRAGALVVGEDLGTVEPWVRDYLERLGIPGTSVTWFEKSPDGTPLPPEHYREYCMASVTTHDMPPTVGYLAGDHIRLQHSLGLIDGSLPDELAHAERELGLWRAALAERGILPDDPADPVETVLALHRHLVASRARVLCVALTDAVGERRTQNQPGVVGRYPNWQVPLADSAGRPMSLEQVFTSGLAARLAAVMNESGRATPTEVSGGMQPGLRSRPG